MTRDMDLTIWQQQHTRYLCVTTSKVVACASFDVIFFGADGIDRARGMVFVIEFRVASNAQG